MPRCSFDWAWPTDRGTAAVNRANHSFLIYALFLGALRCPSSVCLQRWRRCHYLGRLFRSLTHNLSPSLLPFLTNQLLSVCLLPARLCFPLSFPPFTRRCLPRLQNALSLAWIRCRPRSSTTAWLDRMWFEEELTFGNLRPTPSQLTLALEWFSVPNLRVYGCSWQILGSEKKTTFELLFLNL